MAKKLFDFAIGNPPYQESQEATSDKPVYNYLLDAAYEVSEKAEFITPARFLFNAGKTPKAWNEKMLNDPHLKVLNYEKDAARIFHRDRGTDVAIDPFHEAIFLDLGSLRDEVKDVGRPVLDGRVTDVGAF